MVLNIYVYVVIYLANYIILHFRSNKYLFELSYLKLLFIQANHRCFQMFLLYRRKIHDLITWIIKLSYQLNIKYLLIFLIYLKRIFDLAFSFVL
jgi:hypothetical protein